MSKKQEFVDLSMPHFASDPDDRPNHDPSNRLLPSGHDSNSTEAEGDEWRDAFDEASAPPDKNGNEYLVLLDHYGREYLPAQASFGSSVINLTNTILGAGMLGLPYAFANSGYILGMFLLLIFGAASAFGLWLLAESARILGFQKDSSFYAVAMGSVPSAAWLIDVAVVMKCFGVATSYCIVVGDLMPLAVQHASGLEDGDFWINRQLWVSIFMLTMMYPLSLLKTLDALKFTSTLAIGFVFYLIIVVSLYAFIPSLDPCSGKENCPGNTYLVTFNFTTTKVLSIFIFAYTCHTNAFTIRNELENNNRFRMGGVILSSVGVAFVCYTIVAVTGYYSLGDAVKSNVINNYPSDSALLSASRIAIALLVAFSYPLQINPCRASLFQLVFKTSSSSFWRRFLLTTVLCGLTYLIALITNDLGQVLSVVGATGSTIISYILPGLMYTTVTVKYGWTLTRSLACLLAVTGAVFMPVCLTFIFL